MAVPSDTSAETRAGLGPVILGRTGEGTPASNKSGDCDASPATDQVTCGSPGPTRDAEPDFNVLLPDDQQIPAKPAPRPPLPAAAVHAYRSDATELEDAVPDMPPSPPRRMCTGKLSRKASRASRSSAALSARSRVYFSKDSSSQAFSLKSSLSALMLMVKKSTTRVLAIKFTQNWGDADGDGELRGLKLAADSDDEAQASSAPPHASDPESEAADDEVPVPRDAETPVRRDAGPDLDSGELPSSRGSWPSLSSLSRSESLNKRSICSDVPRDVRISPTDSAIAEEVSQVMAGAAIAPRPNSRGLAWKLLVLVLRFPLHCLHELKFYLLPLICALVPSVVVGVVMRAQASEIIPVEGRMMMEEVTYSPQLSLTTRGLSLIPEAVVDVALLATTLSLCCTLWAWRAVRPALARVALPAFLLVMIVQGAVFAATEGRAVSEWLTVTHRVVQAVIQSTMIVGTAFYVGSFTRNRLVMRVYALILGVSFGLYTLCRFFAEPILNGPDATKALFCTVLNPVLFEIFIAGARLVARCVRKNHSSTSFMLVAPIISLKHTVGRFMTAMIMDARWVLIVSIANGVGELLLQSTMPARDAVLYRWLFRPFLREGEAPAQQMQNSRNRALRMNNAAFETMSEVVATWSSAAMVFAIGISKDGDTLPRATGLVQSALIQTGTELLVDLVSIILMFLINRYDTMKLARRRRWFWSIPVCSCMMLTSSLLGWSLLFRILCVVPEKDVVIWTVCPAE